MFPLFNASMSKQHRPAGKTHQSIVPDVKLFFSCLSIHNKRAILLHPGKEMYAHGRDGCSGRPSSSAKRGSDAYATCETKKHVHMSFNLPLRCRTVKFGCIGCGSRSSMAKWILGIPTPGVAVGSRSMLCWPRIRTKPGTFGRFSACRIEARGTDGCSRMDVHYAGLCGMAVRLLECLSVP